MVVCGLMRGGYDDVGVSAGRATEEVYRKPLLLHMLSVTSACIPDT